MGLYLWRYCGSFSFDGQTVGHVVTQGHGEGIGRVARDDDALPAPGHGVLLSGFQRCVNASLNFVACGSGDLIMASGLGCNHLWLSIRCECSSVSL